MDNYTDNMPIGCWSENLNIKIIRGFDLKIKQTLVVVVPDMSIITYLSSCIDQLKIEVLTVHINQFVKRCQREFVGFKKKQKKTMNPCQM